MVAPIQSIPVAPEWIENDRISRVEGYTMDIGSYGCLAIAPQGFLIGQKFATGQSSEQQGVRGTWVRRGQEGSSGWELGLQLQKPAPEFWEIGLELMPCRRFSGRQTDGTGITGWSKCPQCLGLGRQALGVV